MSVISSFSEAFYEKSEAVVDNSRDHRWSGDSRRGGCRCPEQPSDEVLAVVPKSGKNSLSHRFRAAIHRNCGRAVGGMLTGAVPFLRTAPLFCIFFRFLLSVHALVDYGNTNRTDSAHISA